MCHYLISQRSFSVDDVGVCYRTGPEFWGVTNPQWVMFLCVFEQAPIEFWGMINPDQLLMCDVLMF